MANKQNKQRKALNLLNKVGKAGKKVLEGASKVGPKVAPLVAKAGAAAGKLAAKVVSGPVASRIAGGAEIGAGVSDLKNNRILPGVAKLVTGGALLLFNHPEWYQAYPLEGLVNLNFGRRKGILEKGLTYFNDFTDIGGGANTSVPSVAGIEVLLTKPITSTGDWDQAIQYLYSTIRSANAGAVNYNPVDLERYIWDVRNLHAIYAVARRAYATLNNIQLYDATTPRSYFAAMGLDYDSFSANAANLKQYANKYSLMLSRLAPLHVNLIDRTRWMFSNLFADSDDEKASAYVFRLRQVDMLYGKTDCTTIQLAPKPQFGLVQSSNTITFDTFITAMRNAFENFAKTQLYMIIAGDILKAFGEASIYPSEIWDENMPTPLVYDEAALTQIQNARFTYPSEYIITSDPQIGIVNTITINIPDTMKKTFGDYWLNKASENIYINSNKNNLTPGEAISYTRLSHALTTNSQYTNVAIATCGTELCTAIEFIANRGERITITTEGDPQLYKFGYDDFRNSIATFSTITADGVRKFTYFFGLLSAFDYHPKFDIAIIGVRSAEEANSIRFGAIWDWNNYACITADQLSPFHGYAAMSLLATVRVVKQSNAEVIKD